MHQRQLEPRALEAILRHLEGTLSHGTAGDVVEFGCYDGDTSVELQKITLRHSRQLHLYDSFDGLPAKSPEDFSPAGEQFQEGSLQASQHAVSRNFQKRGLPIPTIHKGWFSALPSHALPHHIAFAFIDADFYYSILDALKLVWPRLSNGSMVIVDDYHSEALPGVRKAVDGWLHANPARLSVEADLAVITHNVRFIK